MNSTANTTLHTTLNKTAARQLDNLTSALFVPAGNQKLISSAVAKNIKAVVVDLEDAIPPAQKTEARKGLADDIGSLRQSASTIMVRVNQPWTMQLRDIEAAVLAQADVIMIPKVESAISIQVAADILDELNDSNTILISQIETAKGLLAMPQIAEARTDRHAALMLGPEDLALDLNCESSRKTMTTHAQALITAARAHGLHAIGSPGSITEILDMDAYTDQLKAGRRMGFSSVVAIHPRQLSAIDSVYKITSGEADAATDIISENEKHQGRPFMWNGEMVDAPIVARARALLDKYRTQ
jgi:citrate lyase subunit beta/citryl-CoA lyase